MENEERKLKVLINTCPEKESERIEGLQLKGYWPEGDSLIFQKGSFEVMFSLNYLKNMMDWVHVIEQIKKIESDFEIEIR
jgi:hypothetical protein